MQKTPGTIRWMEILKISKDVNLTAVERAAEVLRAGGLVIYPTETVYGVGVDATNSAAVQKLLAYKSRREGKPLSVAVVDQAMAEQFVELTDQAKKLYERFLPGPYTIVSKGRGIVSPGVESEFGTLGVRIPAYSLILKMVAALGRPVTATSANASGEKRPYTIQDVFDGLSEKQKNLIDLVLDAGELPKNEPSVVIDTTLSTPLTVRGTWQEGGEVFETNSQEETKALAGKLILKYWEQVKEKGLLIALNGELGTVKTVFTAGIAQFLKIIEPIASPTYTYMNEYMFERHGVRGTLHHLDLWKIDSKEMFERLKADQLLQPNAVLVAEWWQQAAAFWPKNQQPDLTISLEETGKSSRSITVQENI
jgi:L-threonylcarbamoyladenylate synthase